MVISFQLVDLVPVTGCPKSTSFLVLKTKYMSNHFLNKDYQELYKKLPLVQTHKGFVHPNFFSKDIFFLNLVCL